MGFTIEDGVMTYYIQEPDVTEVVVPDGVTDIYDVDECFEDGAFSQCDKLTKIHTAGVVDENWNRCF